MRVLLVFDISTPITVVWFRGSKGLRLCLLLTSPGGSTYNTKSCGTVCLAWFLLRCNRTPPDTIARSRLQRAALHVCFDPWQITRWQRTTNRTPKWSTTHIFACSYHIPADWPAYTLKTLRFENFEMNARWLDGRVFRWSGLWWDDEPFLISWWQL